MNKSEIIIKYLESVEGGRQSAILNASNYEALVRFLLDLGSVAMPGASSGWFKNILKSCLEDLNNGGARDPHLLETYSFGHMKIVELANSLLVDFGSIVLEYPRGADMYKDGELLFSANPDFFRKKMHDFSYSKKGLFPNDKGVVEALRESINHSFGEKIFI